MNRSRRILRRTGMVIDAGAPRCRVCGKPLQFGADREGRTTEVCVCGYHAYLETRPGKADGAPQPSAASGAAQRRG